MAKQRNKKWSDYMWLVSATYFTLGFFNIVFAWLGVICFLIPLIMAIFGGGKGYCNNYCGRGQLFLQIGNNMGRVRKWHQDGSHLNYSAMVFYCFSCSSSFR